MEVKTGSFQFGALRKKQEEQFVTQMPNPQAYVTEPPKAPPQLEYVLLNEKPDAAYHPLTLECLCFFFVCIFAFFLLCFLCFCNVCPFFGGYV